MCLNPKPYILHQTFLINSFFSFAILQSVSEDQAKRFAKFRERKHRVEKDVVCIVHVPVACTSHDVRGSQKVLVLIEGLSISCTLSYLCTSVYFGGLSERQ
jgi:hypothetical protein